jgi:hypothetical protein
LHTRTGVDLFALALVVGFFALSCALIEFCDRLLG